MKGAAPAVNGHGTAVKRRLRRGWHNKKTVDSAVPPKSSDHISSRMRKTVSNVLESSSNSQQEESTIRLAFSRTTAHTRQVEEEAAVVQCGDNQSLFRVEVNTDYIPLQTSWELVDVSSNTVVMAAGSFDRGGSIYVETKCLESDLSCYQFTIKDFGSDGICCKYGQGSYKVEYDNQLIKESKGDFGFKEDSELFGDTYACMSVLSSTPTMFPSRMTSTHPTNSQKPTTFPSRLPSAYPTNSQKPTTFPSRMPSAHPTHSQKPTAFPSRMPSSTPSLSFEPTSSPTDFQGFISYGYDTWNRRIFPSPLLREEDVSKASIASYHTWPNCSAAAGIDADRFVGCVSIPKSSSALLASPSWAGTLHSGKAPICKWGKCDLQIPMSNNALKIDTTGANLGQVLQSKANIVEFLSDNLKSSTTRVVTVADVNVDGWPDIIIGNEGEPNQLLMNQGNGEFKEVAGALPDEEHPSKTRAIGVGDMNNDGFPDLIIGNDYQQENTLLLNKGDGTFEYAQSAIPGGGSLRTLRVFIADINSDGHLDVIVFHFSSGPRVQVLLNKGDISTTFEDVTDDAIFSSDTSSTTTTIAVADVNGDGHTDIIIGNDMTEPTQVLLNLGNATFVELEGSIPNTSASSDITLQIAVADLDGDGTIDLVIGNVNDRNPIQIFLNQGNGTFEEGEVAIPGASGIRFFPRTLAVADMDGDGRLDILIGTWNAFPNYLLQNQGSGKFGIVEGAFDESEDGKDTRSIAVSDVNGDGRVDVIIGNYYSDIQVLLNKEDGAYLEVLGAIPGIDNDETLDFAVADLDGDGLPDLVLGNGSKPNQVLLNQGDGTFEEVISDASSRASNTRAVAVGDLNGDGLPDIVMGNRNWMNQGGGVFMETDLFSSGGDDYVTYALALADVNGDGRLDILVGNLKNYPNQLLLNQGDGTFEEVDGAIPGDFDTFAVAVADFNNDGLIDIVIGNYEANQLLLNQGDGTFQEILEGIPPEKILILAQLLSRM